MLKKEKALGWLKDFYKPLAEKSIRAPSNFTLILQNLKQFNKATPVYEFVIKLKNYIFEVIFSYSVILEKAKWLQKPYNN